MVWILMNEASKQTNKRTGVMVILSEGHDSNHDALIMECTIRKFQSFIIYHNYNVACALLKELIII